MCACSNRTFSPPTDHQRAKALGDTYQLNDNIRRAVTIGIDECFLPFPVPNEGDWVSIHEEPGQTVQEFEQTKRTVSHTKAPSLETICEFACHFFPGCELEILPQIDFTDFSKHFQTGKCINSYTKQPQYLASSIIGYLKKMKRRERKHDRQELFCIGVTMADIYSESDWNFVYGLASVGDGIGVYSFARLDPSFPDTETAGLCTNTERILVLKRAISVFVHEVIHLFGIAHCIYYLCLMNGAESEEEMDGQPLYLCPICLRKMYAALGKEKKQFNIIKMYTNILDACKRLHFKDEAAWYENRLKLLNIEAHH
ncbi:unnamed protein product [Rotaria sordida]|uniref:Archaemetzincin-2 n=1 Tax=Rotaria sordida TaxID=392033 RepID=A0A814QAX8_9BILA|nr:unnamed protein product [Rotaria sordida]